MTESRFIAYCALAAPARLPAADLAARLAGAGCAAQAVQGPDGGAILRLDGLALMLAWVDAPLPTEVFSDDPHQRVWAGWREAVDGDFFLFNCLQLLDAVLVERSSGHLVKRYEDGRLRYSPNSDDLCVSKAVMAGHHIWLDGRYLGDAHFFVSDTLMERFRAAGLKGFEAKRVREE